MANRPGTVVPSLLVVDDEEELREAIAFDFQRRHYRVLMAGSGNEAKKILEKEKVDVVLTDVRMPDGDGVDLLCWIKQRSQKHPVVIFVTGYSDLSLADAYEKGIDAVFSKPYDRQVLFAMVERAISPAECSHMRNNTRVETDIPVDLDFVDQSFSIHSKVRNIARGGMFIEIGFTDRFPDPATHAEFRMKTDGRNRCNISGRGVVRWVQKQADATSPSGIGIEFQDFNSDCFKQVIEYINFLKTKAIIPQK